MEFNKKFDNHETHNMVEYINKRNKKGRRLNAPNPNRNLNSTNIYFFIIGEYLSKAIL